MKNMVDMAISIAIKTHAGQVDKAEQAYILHPLRLMTKMTDEESMVVAVLHDVIEDSDTTADDLIQAGLPERVVEAVKCLTRNEGESYDDFIERIRQNPLARRVKIADIEDNLNILRLKEVTYFDLRRAQKYHQAWNRLKSRRSQKGGAA